MDAILQLLTEVTGDAAAAESALDKARADGVTDVASAALVREDEWVAYGLPRIKARALVARLAQQARPASQPGIQSPASLLPQVPDDDSLLEAMRVGGIAKVEPTDVVAAIRVAFADQLGLLDAEERLLDAIEGQARELDEPCPPIFYDLQRSRAQKAHADVLAALGVPGTFVSERRKRELLARVSRLWDVLAEFQQRLVTWQESWQDRVTNPGALLAGLAALVSGGDSPSPGLGMIEAPDAGPVVDAARHVIDAVNRVFAGPGIPVARALAADAVELRALLEGDYLQRLIDAVGVSSRDELLKKLELGVSSEQVRIEKAVAQYVLGLVRLPEQEPGQQPMVIVALKEIGATIPWGQLTAGPGSGGRSRTFA